MKKRNQILIFILWPLISAVVLFGLIYAGHLIGKMQLSSSGTEDRQLKEQASYIDSLVLRRLEIITPAYAGQIFTDEFRLAEEQYAVQNTTDWLMEEVASSRLCQSEYVFETVVRSGGKELFRSEGSRGSIKAELPENANGPCALVRDSHDNAYLALFFQSPNYDIEYITILTLASVFSELDGAALSDPALILLYDGSTGVLVMERTGSTEPEGISVSGRDGAEITSVLSNVENAGHTDTRSCVYHDDRKERHDLTMAVIPYGESMNGRLTVGAAVDYTAFMENNISMSRQTYRVMILIYAGAFLMLALNQLLIWSNVRHIRKEQKLKEHSQETEEQLKNTQALERRERLETIGVLTPSIAHEFGNLLSPVMGYSEMSIANLTEENLDLIENLSQIYKASSRAKHLISKITSFARIDDDAEFQYFSPDSLVEDVRLMAKPAIPGNVAVQLNLGCPEPCIYGDRMQLVQVCLNIVLNAFQAMEDAGGTLTIRTECGEGEVKIFFKDTGKGMTSEQAGRIFDTFYTTKGEAGTGLGLPIAMRIVKAHGGNIKVNSAPGLGAEFIVILPEKTITHS